MITDINADLTQSKGTQPFSFVIKSFNVLINSNFKVLLKFQHKQPESWLSILPVLKWKERSAS